MQRYVCVCVVFSLYDLGGGIFEKKLIMRRLYQSS